MPGAESDSGQKEDQAKQAELRRQERMIGVVRKFGYPFPDKQAKDLTANELYYLWTAIHQIQEKHGIAVDKERLKTEGYIDQLIEAAEKMEAGKAKPNRDELGALNREVLEFELRWRGRQEYSRSRRQY